MTSRLDFRRKTFHGTWLIFLFVRTDPKPAAHKLATRGKKKKSIAHIPINANEALRLEDVLFDKSVVGQPWCIFFVFYFFSIFLTAFGKKEEPALLIFRLPICKCIAINIRIPFYSGNVVQGKTQWSRVNRPDCNAEHSNTAGKTASVFIYRRARRWPLDRAGEWFQVV